MSKIVQKFLILFLSVVVTGTSSQSPQVILQSNAHLAPFTGISTKPQIPSLTSRQQNFLKEIFLNPEMRAVLEHIIQQAKFHLGEKVSDDMGVLSKSTTDMAADLIDEDDDLDEFEIESNLDFNDPTFSQMVNATLTEHLLREIRQKEITLANKMRLHGVPALKIEDILEEYREIMPTEGIQVFFREGAYILVFKDFMLILHHEDHELESIFPKVFHQGKKVFQSPQRHRWQMSLFQFSNPSIITEITQDWVVWEYATKPTEMMIEILRKQSEYIAYLQESLLEVQEFIDNIVQWADLYGERPEGYDDFYGQISSWKEQFEEIISMIDSFVTLQGDESVHRKIDLGRAITIMVRHLGGGDKSSICH